MMAAEVLADAGVDVEVHDAMPTMGRKFLLAGRGGLNLTNSEPLELFVTRYGSRQKEVGAWLATFGPNNVRQWAHNLGIETFVGSSGKVFPVAMEATPLLAAWLQRLKSRGIKFKTATKWPPPLPPPPHSPNSPNSPSPNGPKGPSPNGPNSPKQGAVGDGDGDGNGNGYGNEYGGGDGYDGNGNGYGNECGGGDGYDGNGNGNEGGVGDGDVGDGDAVLLALGGASWPGTGSDGSWVEWLRALGVGVAPFRPANCGFDVQWSEHLRTRFHGEPLKSVAVRFCDLAGRTIEKRGECLVTRDGIEGGAIYALSAPIRDTIEARGQATLLLDLIPERPLAKVVELLSANRGSRSWASHLQRQLGLKGVKAAMLREVATAAHFADAEFLAKLIKGVPVRLVAPRPLAEAISSAGGVTFESLNEDLMLRALPGFFCAGEMIDWEAPTGGYLLTACLASGRHAALGVVRWLAAPEPTCGPMSHQELG